MDVNEKVMVFPEEGNFPAIARALLEAAEHPYQVRYISYPQAGFEVPEDVYQRFDALMGNEETQDKAPEETRKRRPGRPRKETSDPSKKEE